MRVTRIVYLGVVLLLAMVSLPGMATAAPGNSEAAHACQDGGYLTFTDADGNAFKNTGQCVRYAAQGNTLVPIPPAEVSIVLGPGTGVLGGWTLSGSGLEPGSAVLLDFYRHDGNHIIGNGRGYADADGNFFQEGTYGCGNTFSSFTLRGTAADGITEVSDTATPTC